MAGGIKPAISKNLFSHYTRRGEWEADIKAATDEDYKDAPNGFDGMFPEITLGKTEAIDFYKGLTDGFFAAMTSADVYVQAEKDCETKE